MNLTMNIFFDIEAQAEGAMFDLVSWGLKIGQLTVQQAGAMPFEQFVHGISQVYTTHHRGEGIGSVVGEVIGSKHSDYLQFALS